MTIQGLESLIEECISRRGVHLIDLVVKNESDGKSIELYVDSEDAVTAEICSEVSRDVREVIQSAGLNQNRLTVSSPGISRPLKYRWQYKKHIGRQFTLKVRSDDGVHEMNGVLESLDDKQMVIISGKASQSVAFDAIMDAWVKSPW